MTEVLFLCDIPLNTRWKHFLMPLCEEQKIDSEMKFTHTVLVH